MIPGLMGAVAAAGIGEAEEPGNGGGDPEITRTTEGFVFRDQFDAADQTLDGYNSWEEGDPGSYDIVSNIVEARWASNGRRRAMRDMGSDHGSVIVQHNAVRNSDAYLTVIRLNATSLTSLATSYQINVKDGSDWRIVKSGTGVIATGGSVPGTGTIVGVRFVLETTNGGDDADLRAYQSGTLDDLQDLTEDFSLQVSVSDTDRPTGTYYGFEHGDGSSAADADADEFFICGRNIKVTGLPTGWKVQVDSRAAVEESGGEVEIDVDEWALPATTVKVLDDEDAEQASITPGSGVWGGDEYSFSQ